jgi:NAD+ kinase
MPASQSLVVTPVCPHALSSRPLVLKDSVRMAVSVEVREEGDEPAVFADGLQIGTLAAGEVLEIEKSDVSVPLVELDDVNPYEVLTRKLGWSGTSIR